jgi:hypothetical protein
LVTGIEDGFKQHLAPHIADGFTIDPPEYDRLRFWTFILFQLNFATAELEKLIAEKPIPGDQDNFYSQYGRFCAIIITYGRCFASAGAKIPSLDVKDTFKGRPELRKIHDRLDEIRNGVFAHTGHHELVRVTLGVKELDDKILIRHLFTSVMPANEFPDFLKAMNHAATRAVEQIGRLTERLERDKKKPIEVD